jgi:hypothetical protein
MWFVVTFNELSPLPRRAQLPIPNPPGLGGLTIKPPALLDTSPGMPMGKQSGPLLLLGL